MKPIDTQDDPCKQVANSVLEIRDGDVFEHDYPFLRYAHKQEIWELDNFSKSHEFIARWKPATEHRYVGPNGETGLYADGMGKRRLTVYGVFKPSRFPSRVFYTQHWMDPESNNWFGLEKCRIKPLGSFRKMAAGFKLKCYETSLTIEDLGEEAIIDAALKAAL